MPALEPRQVIQQLDRQEFSPLYLLHGEETFMIDEILLKLKEKILDDKLVDFNLTTFYAADCSVDQIVDAVSTLPMMAPRRLVIVKNIDEFSASELDGLMKLVESPIDSCSLVLLASKVDMRKKFFKLIDAKGISVRFQKVYDNQLPPWIHYICKKFGKTISPEAQALLQDWVGTNLLDLNNEIAKVSQYIGNRKQIEVDDLQAVVCRVRADTVFELVNCIGKRDCASSFTHLAHLLESGQNEIGVLSMIVRHFRILILCQEGIKEGLSQSQISQRAGVHGFFVKEYLEQAKRLAPEHIFHVYDVLLDTDRALKSNPLSSHLWLENLVIQSCQ